MKKINILIALLLCLVSHVAQGEELWVGQKAQCDLTDYANDDYPWSVVNISWDKSGSLSTSYWGDFVMTVYYSEYANGIHEVTAKWTETKLGTSDNIWNHESHTWTFSCKDNPLELDDTNISLSGNGSAKIGYHFRYTNEYTSQAKLTYTSSNKNVATVSSDGVVTAKSDGTATITVKSSISKDSKTCTVKVAPKAIIKVTSISLDNTSISLNESESKQLKATVKPDNATDKSVTWSSSNSAVASVDNTGYVKAKSAGSATITCKANDGSGESATCEITVIFVDKTPIIRFVDANVKAICIENWDTNGDGNLSEAEAAAVNYLGINFKDTDIKEFKELKYFTGLKNIGECAFWGCTSLTSIEIPNSVLIIGWNAFFDCKGLTSIEIPNSVTTIRDAAFSYCTSLTSIEIPNSVTTIGNKAFSGCSSLTSFIVSPNNTAYDSRENCNAIIETKTNTLHTGCKNTLIPNSVTTIGKSAFYDCKGLTSIEIPNSVTTIGMYAFYGCTSLTSIEIPNSVTTIGEYAFWNCTSLTSIEIPNSVTTIGMYAFRDCNSLTSIIVSPNNTAYDSRENCNAIIETKTNTLHTGCKNTLIPNSVTTIGMYAFYGCTSLTSIEIPNSVTTIGMYAFTDCSSLKSINIPKGVENIGWSTFSVCDSLKDVYCYADKIPTTPSDAFEESPIASATLHVPQSLIDEYRTTAPWSEFGTIVAIEETSQKGDMDGDGNITVADITQLIEIYLNESNGINEIADLDGDGSITVSDITQLIEKYLNPEGEDKIPVKSIILSVSALELAKGESEQMSVTVSPTDATNPALQWSSSNTSVATVVDGLVTAIGEGTAIITCAATDGSGVEATCKVTVTTPPTTGTHNGHEWVDLGLSVKWATMNIGAYSPEDYGDYFAWGETIPKDTCSWETYKWCEGTYTTLTKYCTDSSYGTVDNKSVLDPEDDAAHVNWGGTWRMPTYDECKELVDKCTTTWTTRNGVNGRLVTGPNGNSIFLPAAGYRRGSSLADAGYGGDYWSSSLETGSCSYAYCVSFIWSYFGKGSPYRYRGQSVRAVCP